LATTVLRRPATSALTIIVVGGTVLSLCMGMRQSFGLFLQPINDDLAVSATAFGFAMALQNLVWGATQPMVGMLGDRYGARPVLIGCALLYAAGLAMMAYGGPFLGLDIGAGVLIGTGIAGTGFGVVLGAVARATPPEKRVQAVGIVSAAGSVGTLFLAPLGQALIASYGWREALLAFAVLALAMGVIAVFIGGRQEAGGRAEDGPAITTREALREALHHPGFMAMTIAFFACGFQLFYITIHLPAYLAICGVSPSVGATALGVIGITNAAGSIVAGQLGARYSQKKLLALIYLLRTLAIIAFLALPVTATSTLVFAAAMGFIWLGVTPLVSGLIGRMFGLQHFNTLFGACFFSHQVGGFLGAWLGGLTYDATGSYATAWGSMIVIGLSAFVLQWFMNDEKRARGYAAAAA
jgi:predicted MFS family arabinose efflux permease